jgi:hypothetical protein
MKLIAKEDLSILTAVFFTNSVLQDKRTLNTITLLFEKESVVFYFKTNAQEAPKTDMTLIFRWF